MCGLIGGRLPLEQVAAVLPTIRHRGPDSEGVDWEGDWVLGHTRLAIQDLTEASAQPYRHGRTLMTYNGEMWFPEAMPGEGRGDTPKVAALLDKYGVDALPMLDGMFALAWVTDGTLYLARDTFGEVPLHYGATADGRLVWASEIAALLALGAVPASVGWVLPGTVVSVSPGQRGATVTRWADEVDLTPATCNYADATATLRSLLTDAVVSRMTADVPVAVLLSGGLDSSLVAATLVEKGYDVHPYVAVHHPTAADRKHAHAIADHLGLTLTEVPVPAPTRTALHDAVAACELPHKAQVEITLACLPLAQRIAADGFKVVLSGEGSDELWASYGMAYHGIKQHGWGPYRRSLFVGQHRKNFPRVNKVFMAHGVEARMPFLHPPLARFALTLPQTIVTDHGRHPKAVLASASNGLLPHTSAWRSKRAFQTDARLDKAAASAVADPASYYRAEFTTQFRGVKP